MDKRADYDAIIVGGGFYGCVLALHLQRFLQQRTLIVEADSTLLGRASYVNQARVHNGYHYPRSLLTGHRSRLNFDRFLRDYEECVDDRFANYYAIARLFSNVTASQFMLFCETIGAPVENAPPEIQRLFDSHLVEKVFRVREAVFDASRLRQRMWRDLSQYGVEVWLETEVARIGRLPDGTLEIVMRSGRSQSTANARRIFNCTYSRLNNLLVASDLPQVALKHELTELVLLELPEPLRGLGITVMCGPFFSILPFPPRGVHSFSHVRYTPHCEWHDTDTVPYRDPYSLLQTLKKESRFTDMMRDARRYLPILEESKYIDSLWEVKTVLPRSEVDDSRPILVKKDHGLEGLTSIMGSKIDNVYDMVEWAFKSKSE